MSMIYANIFVACTNLEGVGMGSGKFNLIKFTYIVVILSKISLGLPGKQYYNRDNPHPSLREEGPGSTHAMVT